MSINKCKIGGIVAEVPKRMNSLFYGDVLEIRLDINRKDIDKIEHVTCLIVDKELIERAMNTIGVGDYLFCFGHFVSLEYKRKQLVKCPHCGKEGYRMRKAQHTDIILRDFEVTKGIDLSDSDGVNRVVLTGVVKNPAFLTFFLLAALAVNKEAPATRTSAVINIFFIYKSSIKMSSHKNYLPPTEINSILKINTENGLI